MFFYGGGLRAYALHPTLVFRFAMRLNRLEEASLIWSFPLSVWHPAIVRDVVFQVISMRDLE